MKQINVKLLAILAVSAIVFLGGTKALHDYQAVKNADTMLVRAEQAKEEGEYEDAVKFLRGYLTRRPDDTEKYSDLALTMKQALEEAQSGGRLIDAKVFHQTYGTIEAALRKVPDDVVLREAAVEFAIRFHRFQDAISHIEHLMAGKPDEFDPELAMKLAQCQLASAQEDTSIETAAEIVGFDPLERTFDDQKAKAPDNVAAYGFLATVYGQRRSRPDIAHAIMDRMVIACGEDADAYLARASMWRNGDEEDKAQARRDVAKAMELAPEDPAALNLAAGFALDDRDFGRARELYDKSLAIDPENIQAMIGLSLWGGATGNIDAAIDYLTQAEERNPRNVNIVIQRANLEINRGDYAEVEGVIEKLRELNAPKPIRDFLEGRVHLQKREWLKAADKLSGARPHIVQVRPEWLTPLDSALALCYENLAQHDLRKDAFQRIVTREPDNLIARWGKIEALRTLKRTSAALEEYATLERQLKSNDDIAGRLLIPHLSLELLQQRDRTEEDRDYKEAEALVRRILKETRINDAAKASVVAQYYTETGQPDKAKAILEKSREKNPDNIVLKLSRIAELASKDTPAARKELDAFQAEHGDMEPVRRLRAQMALFERGEGHVEEIKKQAENVSMFPENDQLRLWARIGQMLISVGDTKGARELWQRVADARPDDIQIRIGVFELSLQQDDRAQQERALDQLRDVVGDGTAEMKWARAMKIVAAVRREELPKSALDEARGLVDDAISSRPGWEPLYRLSGELALRDNDNERAMDAFRMAADLGATNPEVYRNLAVMNFRSQKFRAAREALDKLPQYMWSNREQKMDLELLAREGNLPEEIPINEDSQNADDHNFAGRILASAKRLEEADAAFRRAIKLEPDNPEFWGGLYNLYIENDQREAAEKVLRSAESRLSEANAPMFLGTAYRKLGDWEKSEANYNAAVTAQPENLKILNAMAEMFITSNQAEKALSTLERMVALEDKANGIDQKNRVRWARRRMASITVSSGTYENYERALGLLRANQGDAQTMAPQDLILLGQFAVRRSDMLSRQQAIDIMETTRQRRSLSNQERFQLAALYESVGRWSDCKSLMESLLVSADDSEALLDPWLNWLIEHDDLDKAATWLRKASPGSPAAMRAKAHVDVSRGRAKQAVDAVMKVVPKEYSPQTALQFLGVARMAEELAVRDERIYKLSDSLWTKFAKADPANLIPYSQYLARRNDSAKLVQALKVCDQVRKSGQPVPAIQVATAVLRNDLCPERTKYGEVVRAWSDSAVEENPDASVLYVVRSELEDVLGDPEASEEWLRKFIELGRGTVQERGIVANNLAYKLALAGKGEEAMTLAESSMKLLGPQDALKDTFGMAYLAAGDHARAIQEFESAISVSPSPSKYYHLAVSKWRSGDRDGAAAAFETALELGVMEELKDGPEANSVEAFLKELQAAGVISTDPSESDLEEAAAANADSDRRPF